MTDTSATAELSPSAWSTGALRIARGAAIAAVVAVTFSTALTSLACAVMLLAWLGSGRALSLLAAAVRQPTGAALAAFFAILALGMLHGPVDWGVRLETLWSWRKLAYTLVLLTLFTEERWRRIFVIAFLIVACAGFAGSYLAWLEVLPSKTGHEYGVIFHNHSTQGMIFALAMLCCYQLAPLVSRRMRLVLLAFGILFGLNIVFVSPGRSGYLALIVILVLIGGLYFGWRRLPIVAAAGAVLVAGAIAISPVLQERLGTSIWEITEFNPVYGMTSLGFRRVTFENSLELISERPVLGYGTGSFGAVYSEHVAAKFSDWRGDPATDPHNQYLFIAFENGLIGLIAFVAFLVSVFLTRGVSPTYRWIGIGALLIWMLTSLFSSHFKTFPEGHLIGLFLGAMLAGGRWDWSRRERTGARTQ